MPDRKLTEAEMITYLQISVELGSTASLAPEEAKTLLDLIKRQKAENEELVRTAYKLKSEAVKEFAHFLIDNSTDGTISISDLPDLVIQITEERTE